MVRRCRTRDSGFCRSPRFLFARLWTKTCSGYIACGRCRHEVEAAMITLIANGDVFAPRALGRQSILLLNGRIEKIGDVRQRDVERLDVESEVIDATGCVVCPGLIDPHQHILGGSGERGFSSMTPEIFAEEVVRYGITT